MQNKILELMPADPQAAMALAVEHYTGLIWKTVQKYLENPEDIKECVNDTFMEFYIHRERFDPSRGSLEAFLTGIARKRAVSRYRKNSWRKLQTVRTRRRNWRRRWIWRGRCQN